MPVVILTGVDENGKTFAVASPIINWDQAQNVDASKMAAAAGMKNSHRKVILSDGIAPKHLPIINMTGGNFVNTVIREEEKDSKPWDLPKPRTTSSSFYTTPPTSVSKPKPAEKKKDDRPKIDQAQQGPPRLYTYTLPALATP